MEEKEHTAVIEADGSMQLPEELQKEMNVKPGDIFQIFMGEGEELFTMKKLEIATIPIPYELVEELKKYNDSLPKETRWNDINDLIVDITRSHLKQFGHNN